MEKAALYPANGIDPALQQTASSKDDFRKTQTIALIPAYNEARFIGSLVLATRAYVDQVVVIDDGSRDHTAEIARLAGATVIQHKVNQGKAAAVNTGLEYLRTLKPDVVIMLDGDGQHHAEDIPALLAPVLSGEADIVIGSRFRGVKSDIPTYRQIGQHGLTLVTALASGIWSSDSQSGYRALSPRALECLSFSQGGFSLESEMQFLARDHNLSVIEVPIQVTYAEPAKRSPVKHGVQVLNGILRLVGQTRPLLFFSIIGLIFFLGGTLLGVHTVDIYIRTQELAIGYGMISLALCVVGLALFFTGLVLHSIRAMFLDLQEFIVDHLLIGREAQSEQGLGVSS